MDVDGAEVLDAALARRAGRSKPPAGRSDAVKVAAYVLDPDAAAEAEAALAARRDELAALLVEFGLVDEGDL